LPPTCIGGDCPDAGCDPGIAFSTLRCRLDGLQSSIHATPALAVMRASLDRHLTTAHAQLDAAESRCRSAKRGPAKRKLRAMRIRLGTIRKMLGSSHVRRAISPGLTDPIRSATESLATDARTLAASLTCR
jgi:hypothetical protein